LDPRIPAIALICGRRSENKPKNEVSDVKSHIKCIVGLSLTWFSNKEHHNICPDKTGVEKNIL